ncbi:iron chelate uptake ABC transporter family permease subunit [Salmonella sp. WGH-01]|nr:iron chelate uptake ABC transporter family permease subunit [Salmonella sp. WGH-01]
MLPVATAEYAGARETSARQLGLPLWLWRNLLVIATGWMVGVSVAMAGAIGFIGLVIPHILRLCGLTDHRVLLPGCALAGAIALLLADVVARLALASAELPIGVVTATLGHQCLSGCYSNPRVSASVNNCFHHSQSMIKG